MKFYFFEATDPDIMQKIYRFRYEIVCEELGFFDAHLYPEKLETDLYDNYASHFVVFNEECEIAATIRLIHHSPIGYPTPQHLRIYPHVQYFLQNYKKEKLSEISRVFLAKKHRNMADTKAIIRGFFSDMVYSKMCELDIEYAYAAMEKRFVRLLKMFHIHFDIIGDEQKGYGSPRHPCIIFKDRIAKDNPEVVEKLMRREWY